ncbi:MAG TPA: LysM peptidoglycan-binding domain-containing protein [Firmicutes bacterium]|nr:LysM peptidoglycan-binding domain-containing protein [Bacillota bacterium]
MRSIDLQRFATAGPSTGSGRVKRKRSAGRSKEPTAVVYPLRPAARQRRNQTRNRPARPLLAPRPPALPPQDLPVLTTKYVVQAGDTLHRIARRFGTSARLLATLNHLHKPALLVPGEVVLVPEAAPEKGP